MPGNGPCHPRRRLVGSPPRLAYLLDRFVVAGLVSAETATSVGRHRDSLDWSAVPARQRWALSAVVSAAAGAAGLADPDPIRTAEAYVGLRWAELAGQVAEAPWLHPEPAALGQLVSDAALATVAERLYAAGPDYRPRIKRVLSEAGRPDMIEQIEAETASQDQGALQALLGELDRHAADPSTTALPRSLYAVLATLRAHRRDADLARAGQHALSISDGSYEARATLLAVLGAALKDARRPDEFLALAGFHAQEWETEIRPHTRVALVVERSNALRLTGRADLALDALLSLHSGDVDQLRAEDQRRLRRNIAMLRREAGAADTALRELTALLPEAADDGERLEVLQSLANVTQFLGNARLTLAYLEQALELATGPRANHKLALTTSLATTQAALGLPLTDLRPVLDSATDPLTILAAGAATAAALEHDPASLESDLVESMLVRLSDIAAAAVTAGDRMVELNALRGTGAILDVVHPEAARDVWQKLVDRRGLDQADPLELAALAHHQFRHGQPDRARALMLAIPDALALELGGTTDISAVLDATGRLKAKFRLLGDDVLAADPPHLPDIRLTAELRRDALGQVRARARHRPDLGTDPAAFSTTSLTLPDRDLWVLEWLDTTPGILGLLTRMDASGRARTEPLPPVAIDPVRLARDLRARLNGWLTTNPGDPLEHPEWNRAEDWLRTALADAQPGDHLVVIDHEAVSGLPWHAIPDTAWTTSYAAGWTAMVRARGLPRPDLRRIGHVSVPALGESAAVTAAFADSRARADVWSQDRGLGFDVLSGPDANTAAVLSLLQRCDLVTFHCHGLYKPDERDIALMLADNQRLPPQRAHEVEQLTGHQLSWRDLQHLPVSPALVLSAACSSGSSVVAGLGERLGLYGALRHAGTRTVIAPAWDAVATDVVGQLEKVRDRIAAGESAAQAVKAVADQAAASLPRWRARVLAVDGDWA